MLNTLLTSKIDGLDQVKKGVISHSRMVLSFTGMTTAKIARDFGDAADTQAHCFDIIIYESIEIIKCWDAVRSTYKNKDSFSNHYILNGQGEELQTRKYPHLIYCAFKLKRLGSSGDTWKNYQGLDGLTLSIATSVLDSAVGKNLEMIECSGSSKAKEFVTARGKATPVDSAAKADMIAQLIAALTRKSSTKEVGDASGED